ncbi:MAG TPA: NAD(P)H-dependent oxidoreductase [Vicinamibacteria bacterium]|nr:NAD(P)H-dependent oxidoreductase [Vicinamibacteria bacterium]
MSDRISVLVVNGSVRPGNYTAKASALVVDELRKDPQVSVEVIDPGQLDLPLPGARPGAESTRRLKEKVAAAAGIVLATPEYHGSFSSVMKLVIENLGFPSALAGKPVALLGVAAGAIGAIKSLEQLRSVCAHVGALALPLPVSVANVQKVFDAEGRCLDPGVEKLVRSVATNLTNYLRKAVCPAIQLERILREGVA